MTPPSVSPSTATETETASGQYVNLADPDPRTIRLDDIAHGLAHTCRYNGQVTRFYSVAEHALHVSDLLAFALGRPDLALLGLHHDDAEAYLGDLTRPLKLLIGNQYAVATRAMENAIRVALRLPSEETSGGAVKQADNLMLAFEARELMHSRGAGWSFLERVDMSVVSERQQPVILGLEPKRAKELWLERHHQLTSESSGPDGR